MSAITQESRSFGEAVTIPYTRRLSPVGFFSVLGLIFFLVQGYAYGRWILSGPTPTSHGSDPVPRWMEAAAIAVQAVGFVLLVAALFYFVVRPWRKEGRITTAGLVVLAAPTCYWQDLGSNYFNHIYTYNSALVNFGSWFNYIPGWSSPNGGNLAEPLLWAGPMYVHAWAVPAIGIAAVMRFAKGRWPSLGAPGLLGIALASGAVVDVVLEPAFIRLGLYTFAGSIPSLTAWSGEYYQFPLYEPILLGMFICAPAVLLYWKDDRGLTFVERGIDRLGLTGKRRTGLRYVAIAGGLNLVLFLYNVVFALISLMPTFSWAEDIVENRSYLRNEVCGSGTSYACPAADIPIPRRGGIHIDPEGRAVQPGG